MNKKTAPRVIGYGLLLFIITMVLLFVMSVITESDQPLDKWWVSAVMAIIMMAVSLWFSRTLRPGSASQAFLFGGVWAIMIAGLLLAIAIPNGTTNIVFGQWPTYLVFIGVAVGPVLLKPKATPPVVGETQNKV